MPRAFWGSKSYTNGQSPKDRAIEYANQQAAMAGSFWGDVVSGLGDALSRAGTGGFPVGSPEETAALVAEGGDIARNVAPPTIPVNPSPDFTKPGTEYFPQLPTPPAIEAPPMTPSQTSMAPMQPGADLFSTYYDALRRRSPRYHALGGGYYG